jgi:hypothetical protein
VNRKFKVHTVKRLLLCLTLAALPSFGGARQAPLAPVALYTRFQVEPSDAIREALQSELETIMNPVGLRFEWKPLSEGEKSTAVELVVVTFKGHCDLGQMQPLAVMPGALGWTHVSDGLVLPFSDVDCDAVRGFLQKEMLSRPADSREEIYGRALGRVLAHELYHVFAGTAIHGACGVAKSGYTVTDLLSREFVFEAAELRTLLKSKAHQVLEKAAEASIAP